MCADADEAASLNRLERELEVQVRTSRPFPGAVLPPT